MTDSNPYAAPSAQLNQPVVARGNYTPGGRAVDAGQGVEWLKAGFRMFFAQPLNWLIGLAAMFGVIIVMSLIPFVNLLVGLINPIFMAGFFNAGERQSTTGKLDIGDFFRGFREKTKELIIVGAIAAGAIILVVIVVGMAFGGSVMLGMLMGRSSDGAASGFGAAAGLTMVLGMLFMVAIMIPLIMALYFAPALVLLAGVQPVQALKDSFNACLKNIVPFLVYSLVVFVAMIAGSIPLGLGLFVVIPALMASYYPAYKSIFES